MSLDKIEKGTLRVVFKCSNEEQMEALVHNMNIYDEVSPYFSSAKLSDETLMVEVDCIGQSKRSSERWPGTEREKTPAEIAEGILGELKEELDWIPASEIISMDIPQFD